MSNKRPPEWRVATRRVARVPRPRDRIQPVLRGARNVSRVFAPPSLPAIKPPSPGFLARTLLLRLPPSSLPAMSSGFPGLTRVSAKPPKSGKAKAPPFTPPSSSPPPAPIPSRPKPNKNATKGGPRPASKPAATASAPKHLPAMPSKPAIRFASIEESSSGDEDNHLAASVKTKKRPHAEPLEEPVSGDEDPAPNTISKKIRVLPPVTYDAEVIRQFELVMECST